MVDPDPLLVARRARTALARQRELRRQHRALLALRAQLTVEQAVLEERALRESVDVDRFQGHTLEAMRSWILGTYHADQQRERSEALAAGFEAMAHADLLQRVEAEEERVRSRLVEDADIAFFESLAGISAAAVERMLEELAAATAVAATEAVLERLSTFPTGSPEEGPSPEREAAGLVAIALLPDPVAGAVSSPDEAEAIARATLVKEQASLEHAETSTEAARHPTTGPATRAGGLRSIVLALGRRLQLEEGRRQLEQRLDALTQQVTSAQSKEARERADVERLEASAFRVFAWATNDLAPRLARERDELEQAIRERRRAEVALDETRAELDRTWSALLTLGSPAYALEHQVTSGALDPTGAAFARAVVEGLREVGTLEAHSRALPERRADLRSLQRAIGGIFTTPEGLIDVARKRLDTVRDHNRSLAHHQLDLQPVPERPLEQFIDIAQQLADLREDRRGRIEVEVNNVSRYDRERARLVRPLKRALALHREHVGARRAAADALAETLETRMADARRSLAAAYTALLAHLAIDPPDPTR